MNALILSDLHFPTRNLIDGFCIQKQKRIINNILNPSLKKCDVVIIAGDVVESSIMKSSLNPFDALYYLFDKEIIFCLGNHEFAYQSHPDVIKYWSQFKHPKVHCLDIDGKAEIMGINFVGNVLWYDFTLNKNPLLMQGEIINGWLDSTIKDFDPMVECQKCKDQIFSNLSKDKKNVLITHMVPHVDLNTFSKEEPYSPYNAYSGSERFILDCQDKGFEIEYAVCGHTHRRECKEIWNIKCINIGNDYFHKTGTINYMTINI
jgi:predicted phosphodiesterase